mgnify:FL=1
MQFLKQEYTVQERMNGFKKLQNTISIATSTNSKFFIGRLSGNECRFCGLYLAKKDWKRMIPYMSTVPGICITNNSSAFTYVTTYLEAVRNCNLLGVWDKSMYSQAEDFYKYLSRDIPFKQTFHACGLEPYYFFDKSKYNLGNISYTIPTSIRGKRILIISSHIHSVEKQLQDLNFIYYPHKIFNDNEFVLLRPPMTLAGNGDNIDWVHHFNYFKNEVAKKKDDFDIALVSCGGYGMPISNYIYKDLNKSCIYVGGALQLFFGINGNRWKNNETVNKYKNSYWINPLKEDIPKNHLRVEGSAYWS